MTSASDTIRPGSSSTEANWLNWFSTARIDAVRQVAGHESIGGFGGQWAKYEGLTCNIAEWINSAGGQFLNAEGKPQVSVENPAIAQVMEKETDHE